jgi:hypothetical protein
MIEHSSNKTCYNRTVLFSETLHRIKKLKQWRVHLPFQKSSHNHVYKNNTTTERCFIISLEFPEHIEQHNAEIKAQVTYRSTRELAYNFTVQLLKLLRGAYEILGCAANI